MVYTGYRGGGGLNVVEPIRDKEVIKDMIDYLRLKSDRDALLFMFGIYSGLRISDIIKLRVRDVKGKDRVAVKARSPFSSSKMNFPHVLQIFISEHLLFQF